MSGVFLSYSRADRPLAVRVLKGLRDLGVDVWWDEDMPGVDWQEELARQINELAAVIVLWTPMSTSSKNVRDEARLGQHTDKLINAMAGATSPPFPFDRINGLPLDGWNGIDHHGGWTRLVATVEDRLVSVGAAKPGELTAALAQHEASIARLREALAGAEDGYQAAKTDEGAAALATGETDATLKAAQAQMRHMAELNSSPGVLRAAQSDLDAAYAAHEEAERGRRAAASALATASRSVSRSRSDLARMIGEPPATPPPAPPPPPPPAPAVEFTAAPSVAAPTRPRRSLAVPLAAAGLGAVVLVGLALFANHPAPRRTATTGGLAVASPAAGTPAAPGNPPSAPTTEAVPALDGQWSGEGTTCAAGPLSVALNGQTVSLTSAGQTASGTLQSVGADGSMQVKWPDGVWSYAVSSQTLTMTPPRGPPFVYTRCAG